VGKKVLIIGRTCAAADQSQASSDALFLSFLIWRQLSKTFSIRH